MPYCHHHCFFYVCLSAYLSLTHMCFTKCYKRFVLIHHHHHDCFIRTYETSFIHSLSIASIQHHQFSYENEQKWNEMRKKSKKVDCESLTTYNCYTHWIEMRMKWRKPAERSEWKNPIKYQVQPWTFLIVAINHNENEIQVEWVSEETSKRFHFVQWQKAKNK